MSYFERHMAPCVGKAQFSCAFVRKLNVAFIGLAHGRRNGMPTLPGIQQLGAIPAVSNGAAQVFKIQALSLVALRDLMWLQGSIFLFHKSPPCWR